MATIRLAWRSLAYHRVRTAILVLSVALASALPLAVQVLIARYEDDLVRRAESTPLVVGAPGSRFDLLLCSLYFRGEPPRALSLADSERIGASGLATAIPLTVRGTARGAPLVGTTLDYFSFRGLVPATGTLPQLLGDAVLGAEIARALDLAPEGRLLTDSGRLYDIGSTYPLRLRVAGVLAPSGSPDDGAVFVDLHTAWVAAGIGHGHEELGLDADPALVLRQGEGSVTANAAVREYTEITPANIASFHFHGGSESWPVTAVVVVPPDARSGTILKARLEADEALQPIVPRVVLDETFEIVFRVKRFFDANTALVTVSTALLLALVATLGWKIRERERETLFKIGAGRATIARIAAMELALVLAAGAGLAAGVVLAIVAWLGSRWGL
jgi:putative ABC transport system permease protein